VNAVVFDGEGCSIDVFKAFDKLNKGRKKKFYTVTVLDSNQYRWEDFNIRDGEEARVVEDVDSKRKGKRT